ncbi:hypothetical protein CR513_25555, partial [Mucuna pruriens]
MSSAGAKTVIPACFATPESCIPRNEATAEYPPAFRVWMAWSKESEELTVWFFAEHEELELGLEKAIVVDGRGCEFDVVDGGYPGGGGDGERLAGEHGRDPGAGGEEAEAGRRERERGEMEAEEVEGWLAGFLEGGVGGGEDGGGRGLLEKGFGHDFEREGHRHEPRIGENIGGVEYGFARKTVAERDEEGEEEEERERGRHR